MEILRLAGMNSLLYCDSSFTEGLYVVQETREGRNKIKTRKM